MPTSYTGAWRRQQAMMAPGARNLAGSVPDGQHRAPDANPGDRPLRWDTTGARIDLVPEEMVDADAVSVDRAGPGPLDLTPVSHEVGLGFGAGLPLETSMAVNADAHDVDQGATTARRYTTPTGREAGSALTVSRYQQPHTPVGSPDQLRYQQTANLDVSPAQRIGYRQTRVWDRIFDYRWFASDHRPRVLPNAYSAPDTPPAPAGGPYMTPYSSQAPIRVVRTVLPQRRVSPRPWDEQMATDGSAAPPDAPMPAWGL